MTPDRINHSASGWCARSFTSLWRPLLSYGYSYIKHPVQDRDKPSFVIFDIRALWRSPWASECPGVKNYKWRLNPVWHSTWCFITVLYSYVNSGRQRDRHCVTNPATSKHCQRQNILTISSRNAVSVIHNQQILTNLLLCFQLGTIFDVDGQQTVSVFQQVWALAGVRRVQSIE